MNVHGRIVGLLALAGGVLLAVRIPSSWVLLAAAAALMTALWVVSLPLENVSIIDIAWGPVFALMGFAGAWSFDRPWDPATLAALSMVTLWAVRLAAHLAARNLGKPEDFRYRKFREDAGNRFVLRSLFTIFWLQAFLAWVIFSPVIGFLAGAATGWGLWQTLGVLVFAFGFLFEAIADWQLKRFKADPANEGRVLSSGLWGLSRHPNYFGEAVLWWGIFVFVAPLGGWPYVLGPVLLTWMLLKVSGVTMLEQDLEKRKPEYRDYVRDTPAFVPRPRRTRGAS